ncbi:MAG: RluA family pseudouridine synthase [Bacillus sp. (in: firmicutes)]
MTRFELKWNVGPDGHGKPLREFLREKSISKAALTDIKFKGGSILVDDEEQTVRYHLTEGESVKVLFPEEKPSEGLIPEDLPLRIVYEDQHVLVVDKPAYMNTIPSREHPCGSVANGIIGYYQRTGVMSTFHVVTRLDRDTSGLLLVAKHRHGHHILSEQQKKGTVNRTYEALVHGRLSGEGTVEEPIGRKGTSIIEREVRADGQYACTLYRAIEFCGEYTRIELNLRTGRTHQIRVHMSHLGHPLLGDDLYGGSTEKMDRQALHCKKLSFIHPISEERLTFTADLPEDMKRIWN